MTAPLTPLEDLGLQSWLEQARHETELALATADAIAAALQLLNAENPT